VARRDADRDGPVREEANANAELLQERAAILRDDVSQTTSNWTRALRSTTRSMSAMFRQKSNEKQ
jgi:hypothetical protein